MKQIILIVLLALLTGCDNGYHHHDTGPGIPVSVETVRVSQPFRKDCEGCKMSFYIAEGEEAILQITDIGGIIYRGKTLVEKDDELAEVLNHYLRNMYS